MALQCDISYQIPYQNSSLLFKTQLLKNDILCLLGLNGSGKSTILKLISGLLTPQSGEIILNDKIIFSKNSKINLLASKRQVGYVFQNYMLFPHMKVIKNLKFACRDEKLLEYLIKQLDVEKLLNYYPKYLSGGQTQKIAIIQTLINKPKLLLLDESFANLDVKTTDNIKVIIKENFDIPIIMTSHREQDSVNFANKYHTLS